jgi:hypothetical protein
MRIEVAIERLVLDGIELPLVQQARLQAAIEAELGRLMLEGGLATELAQGGALPALRGGTLNLSGQADPAQLGRQIARAVYQGLGRADRRD